MPQEKWLPGLIILMGNYSVMIEISLAGAYIIKLN